MAKRKNKVKDVADLHENGKGDGDGTDAQSITQVPQDSSQAESTNGNEAYVHPADKDWRSFPRLTIPEQKAGVPSTSASIFPPAAHLKRGGSDAARDLAQRYNEYFKVEPGETEYPDRDPTKKPDRHDKTMFELSKRFAAKLATEAKPVTEEQLAAEREKDYYRGKTGPVRREHFDEFVKSKDHNDSVMRELVMKAASKAFQEKKERLALQAQLDAQNNRLKAYEQLYGAEPGEVTILARDTQRGEVRERWYAPNSSRNIPVRDGNPDGTPPALENESDAGQFLWPTVKDQANELTVEVLLNRCRLKSALNHFKEVEATIAEALRLANELAYQPLIARCSFYLAVAFFGQGEYDKAQKELDIALGAKNHYKEGHEVSNWDVKVLNELRKGEGQWIDSSSDENAGERLSDTFETDSQY